MTDCYSYVDLLCIYDFSFINWFSNYNTSSDLHYLFINRDFIILVIPQNEDLLYYIENKKYI